MTLTVTGRAPPERAPATRSVIELPGELDEPFDVATAYDEHGASLYAFALNALGDRAEAEECVQDAFTRAWRARGSYRPERATVRTWLFAITRNLVADALRARRRLPHPVELTRAGERPDPADPMTASLDRLVVADALEHLSEEHREVVVRVRLNGMSYEELSRITHVPVATLRTRMYYGLRSLRKALKEAGENHA